MHFDSLIGQPVAQEILATALSSTRTSHAYLFVGPDGTGKSACALEFARAIVGAASHEHADILVVSPEGTSLKIDQARRVQKELSLSPVASPRRVAVLKQADRMTTEAANSLLKLLEDPPPTSMLILIATHQSAVLPTVLSRCQVVPFRPAPLRDVEEFLRTKGIDAAKAKALAALSGGIIGRALALSGAEAEAMARTTAVESVRGLATLDPWTLASKMPQDRAELLEIVTFMAWMFRDAIAKSVESADEVLVNVDIADVITELASRGTEALRLAVDEIMLTRRKLERNCSIPLALELLFIKLARILTR